MNLLELCSFQINNVQKCSFEKSQLLELQDYSLFVRKMSGNYSKISELVSSWPVAAASSVSATAVASAAEVSSASSEWASGLFVHLSRHVVLSVYFARQRLIGHF